MPGPQGVDDLVAVDGAGVDVAVPMDLAVEAEIKAFVGTVEDRAPPEDALRLKDDGESVLLLAVLAD